MNKTKRLILDTALNLFNEKGLAQVSLRTIAESMRISPGNLTYHFKKREEIVEALYYEFVAEVEERFEEMNLSEIKLNLVFDLILMLTETRLKYRFLMRDFTTLIAENPSIKKHYVAVIKKRKSQSMGIFDHLIELKILRPAELENEYEHLYERIQILGNFWITSALMQGNKMTNATVERNFEMVVQIMYPYLTNKGKREWERLT
ncbi:MAG: TetR family transcriptional regulator [Crocinitomicaceae bacterium]|nr:TetR family transcriptional regulator [Crocinitomicaceae bacterium]